jgi:hypothetical protein
MSSHSDEERRSKLRGAALGLVVVATTISADLATFSGHVDVERFMSFGLAGLSAAVLAVLTGAASKKILNSIDVITRL